MNALATVIGQVFYDAISYVLTGGRAPSSRADERIADALEELVTLKRAELKRQTRVIHVDGIAKSFK